jgi:hypothetical protein
MNEAYLTNEHVDAHLDWPSRPITTTELDKGWSVCPKCNGWGGHNLRINAYPLRAGLSDTAENRHRYRHFRCQCDQCFGWGRVTASDAECIHEWQMGRNLGRCLSEWVCVKCQAIRVVDSSD